MPDNNLKKERYINTIDDNLMECELCAREMKNLTVHHLIPRQHTKRKNLEISPTIDICSACHRQIHVLFDNKRLAKELNTIKALKAEPQMGKF